MAYANEDAGPGGNGFFLPEEKMPELAEKRLYESLQSVGDCVRFGTERSGSMAAFANGADHLPTGSL